MREWINLFESDGTVTLYRGDSSEIEHFLLSKTDDNALLGIGIYLTDSPNVAQDYTVKGSEGIEYRYRNPENDWVPTTPRELVTVYLRKIMTDEGVDQELADLKSDWQQKYHEKSSRWVVIKPDGNWERPADYDQKVKAFNEEYQAARSKMVREGVAKAKAIFAKRRQNLRIIRLTTGECVFTKVSRAAVITKFEVPRSYLEECLHAERPLPDKALKAIRDAFIRAAGGDENRPFDLRIAGPNGDDSGYSSTFDNFIAGYKKHGARYAWLDKHFGGKGENPSLDLLWNGTHSGYHVFGNKAAQELLIADLMAVGYVGFTYDGGVRLAGTGARGGGGLLHNAYVFWDEEKLNTFRVGSEGVNDDEVGDIEKGIRYTKVAR